MTTLHAVFGGRLLDLSRSGPEDIQGPDLIGLFEDAAVAHAYWKSASYANVDDAHLKYFVLPLDMSLAPEEMSPTDEYLVELILAIGTDFHRAQMARAKAKSTGDRIGNEAAPAHHGYN